MKKILACILAALMLAACAFAETENPADVYRQIMSADRISAVDAHAQMAPIESDVMEIVEFQQLLANLQTCGGTFLQLPEEGGSGKTYSADLEFYFEKGTLMCNIEYTNYAGTISDGTVEVMSDSEYLFVTHPEGAFHSKNTVFTIEIAPEKLHIQWGDGVCDYTLTRGTEEQEAVANTEPAFTETGNYAMLVQAVDNSFSEQEHACHYDPESKAFTACIALGSGYRDALLSDNASINETWQSILESMQTFTHDMDEVLTILSRESLTAYSEAQFAIVFAEKLSADGLIPESDQLARIADGVIVYNILDDDSAPDSAAGAQATIGESNALRQAQSYLDFMTFSRDGLIEQLEYDGFTHDEAVYGVENCGADWFDQAVKSAVNYLDFMAFSRDELIEQLEHDGFTHDQAVHGVENCSADWFDQAVKSAADYLDLMPFSRLGLIEQLEYEGFTHDQAVYGAEQNGY